MSPHPGKESALELLLEQPARLEPGLVVLDRRLPLDESVEVDALLRDSLGYPVVVLFLKGEIAAELGRMAAVVAGLQRGRFLLARLFGDKGLDVTLRPRFVLLGTRFADNTATLLDMMAGVEVHALEYRVVTGSGGAVLDLASFHRTSGPSLVKSTWRAADVTPAPPAGSAPPSAPKPAAAGSPSTLPPEAPASPTASATPTPIVAGGKAAARGPGPPAARKDVAHELQFLDDDGGGLDRARNDYVRARDSIRSLSKDVVESHENGHVQYRVHDADLARLFLDKHGFALQVGDGERVRVTDEATFNERLNAVFTLYFHRLGPDRPAT